jgi:hypothetical protein
MGRTEDRLSLVNPSVLRQRDFHLSGWADSCTLMAWVAIRGFCFFWLLLNIQTKLDRIMPHLQ